MQPRILGQLGRSPASPCDTDGCWKPADWVVGLWVEWPDYAGWRLEAVCTACLTQRHKLGPPRERREGRGAKAGEGVAATEASRP